MIRKYPYLEDSDFLYQIDSSHYTEQYVKITALTWEEQPLEEIQGMVTGGSINLNGDSSLRRTLNLTASFKNDDIAQITNVDNIFSLNKKIYLEVGITNTTNKYTEYPIIWYPQGLYIINQCSISHNLSGVSISAQIHDKMALLNGTCGGTIPASTQLDRYDTVDENGAIVTLKPIVYQIIQELVNHFGGEQLGKIIISDVPRTIKSVMKWLGSTPIYLVTNGDNKFFTTDYSTASAYTIDKTYTYGDSIGYIYSDYIYIKDFVVKPGSTVVQALDTIVSYLGGNYEYFYDVYGNFIFREKKNYLNVTQARVVLDELNNGSYKLDMTKGKKEYDFTDKPIVISASNTPQYKNIKNDFVVWGVRTSTDKFKIPIRYHLAIDTKPKIGNVYEDVFFYVDPDDGILKAKLPIEYDSISSFPVEGVEGLFYKDKSTSKLYVWNSADGAYEEIDPDDYDFRDVKTTDWRTELYLQGVAAEPLGLNSNYYYAELKNEWPKIYDIASEYDSINGYWTGDFKQEYKDDPSQMDFFLDFIDSTAEISKFSVSNIGRRSQIKESNNFNCVFEPEIPNYVLIETGTSHTSADVAECNRRNQPYIQVDSKIYSMLGLGGEYNSCFVEIKNLLYTYTNYNENIQLQTLPIFHLEPNIRIGARDQLSDIYGEYFIKSISVPLTVGGAMSINAIRANEKL